MNTASNPRGPLATSPQTRNLSLGPETIVRRRLDNGIIALAVHNPASASVTIEGDLLAGSIHETDAASGLAGLTVSMLRRGTAKHTFQELNVALDNVGASLSFSAGQDDIGLGGRALGADFDLLAELLAEVLSQPTFPQTELEKLRGQVLTHLSILEMDTSYRAERAFMDALYPDHPYVRPIMGTRDSFRALSVQDVRAFYENTYHPETLVVSIVGGIDAQRALDRLDATLGQWRVKGEKPVRVIPPAQTPSQIIERRVELPGKSQVDLIWGVVGMARTSPDYYAAMMANLVLGRLGLMGRLGASVRDEQGLAYYVGSNVQAGPGPHPWEIAAGVNPQHVERAVDSILREVARLRDEPISDEELADSRTYLTGALPLRLETNEGIAGYLLSIEAYGLGLDYLQRYPGIVNDISREEIQRVARVYLTLDRYVLAMSGTFGPGA